MSKTTALNTNTVRTRAEKKRLTDTLVRKLPTPAKGNRIVYDEAVPGFGVRVTAGGTRSFILNYWVKGRERRMTIGQFPSWTAISSRTQAQRLRREIDLGHDPLAERNEKRSAPTVRHLFERYEREHLPTKSARSAADDRSMWKNDILPAFGSMKVAGIRPQDCDALHHKISRDRPVRANRVLEVLRKALNLAIRWGWLERNPASGCRRNPEQKRHRYLARSEVAKLVAALTAHPERISADALLFMLLTGCRRGEALNAQWSQIDMRNRIWTKPSSETKQRREHRVPFSSAVEELLCRRRAETVGTYIFPGRLGTPFRDVRRTWQSVCKETGIGKVRIHDLRHTFASLAASSGQTLLVVGELLGHFTAQTTKRYAGLYDDSLRSAAEDVASSIGLAMPSDAMR